MYNGTYCDNEAHRQKLLTEPANKSGLYQHELAVLECAQRLDRCSLDESFDEYYEYGVNHYICLLHSLIDRGYLKMGSHLESAEYYACNEIKTYLKTKNIKLASSREDLVFLLRKYGVEEEAKEYFPERRYVLTEKGEQALADKDTPATIENRFIEVCAPEIKHFDVIWKTGIHVPECSLQIDTYRSGFFYSATLPYKCSFPVYLNESLVFYAENIDRIVNLNKTKTIVFQTHDENIITETTLNVVDGSVQCSVSKDETLFSALPFTREEFLAKIHSVYPQYPIQENCVTYYFSINDELVYYILKECFQNIFFQGDMRVGTLRKIAPNDYSHNIVVRVRKSNLEINLILYHLAKTRNLFRPKLYNIDILWLSRMPYYRELLKEDLSPHIQRKLRESYIIFKDAWDRIENGPEQNEIEKHLWQFPIAPFYDEICCDDPAFVSELRRSYEKADIAQKYQVYMDKAVDYGVFIPEWRSEFSLYLSVARFFPNAEFQKRFDWLGQQSLDIYIPSINTAIEYQGKQHYEMIERFGGQSAFDAVKERDTKKRELCKLHHVDLREWSYSKKIDPFSVHSFLFADKE